jgi:hypothetical protein
MDTLEAQVLDVANMAAMRELTVHEGAPYFPPGATQRLLAALLTTLLLRCDEMEAEAILNLTFEYLTRQPKPTSDTDRCLVAAKLLSNLYREVRPFAGDADRLSALGR